MPITSQEIALLQQQFPSDRELLNQLAINFYEKLFAAQPHFRQLFSEDIEGQSRSLMAIINIVLNSAGDLEPLIPIMKQLGEKHRNFGVQPEYYEVFNHILVESMREAFTDSWDQQLEDIWVKIFKVLADTMRS